MSVYILIPAFNEEKNILYIYSEIRDRFVGIDHKIVFSDDGSSDNTWNKIQQLCSSYSIVKGIRLSTNCGKECALDAGLRECEKYNDMECVIIMDCDMQHPPSTARKMYDMWMTDGYDIISGIKNVDNRSHIGASRLFNKIFSKISKIDMTDASDFKLLSANAVRAINEYCEHTRFFRAIVGKIGMKTAQISFCVAERAGDRSKWSNRKLIKYALDNIISYSNFPSRTVLLAAAIFFAASVLQSISSFTIGALIALCTACILSAIAAVGIYVGRIYNELREHPKYFIWERAGFDDKTQ